MSELLGMAVAIVLSYQSVDANTLARFIEERRGNDVGPGKVTLTQAIDLNKDGTDDHFVAYTYEYGNDGQRTWGQYVVAFVSTPSATFEPTNVLLISDSDLMFYSDFTVQVVESGVEIGGLRRRPGDAMCCPTSRATLLFGLVDGKLEVLEGHWYRDPNLRP